MDTITKDEKITVKTYVENCDWEIEKRRAFGWTYDESSSDYHPKSKLKKWRFIGRKRLTFTRPADIPNKEKLNELETKYEEEEKKRRTYIPIDPFNAFILFVLFIIPGIIYIAVKEHQKKKIEKENTLITETERSIESQARQIISSRDVQPQIKKLNDDTLRSNVKISSPTSVLSKSKNLED
ncbi:MAG TPA: hypothetical protein DEA32_01405 [Firmicutes bacterium]|nr:hypothetical protein [Bacillota bacterium]